MIVKYLYNQKNHEPLQKTVLYKYFNLSNHIIFDMQEITLVGPICKQFACEKVLQKKCRTLRHTKLYSSNISNCHSCFGDKTEIKTE